MTNIKKSYEIFLSRSDMAVTSYLEENLGKIREVFALVAEKKEVALVEDVKLVYNEEFNTIDILNMGEELYSFELVNDTNDLDKISYMIIRNPDYEKDIVIDFEANIITGRLSMNGIIEIVYLILSNIFKYEEDVKERISPLN